MQARLTFSLGALPGAAKLGTIVTVDAAKAAFMNVRRETAPLLATCRRGLGMGMERTS
jgi:hypothetical protein